MVFLKKKHLNEIKQEYKNRMMTCTQISSTKRISLKLWMSSMVFKGEDREEEKKIIDTELGDL